MLVNVSFHFKHSKQVNLVYLYEKLRFLSKDSGGYFNLEHLTKNERYTLLPKLKKLGWVLDKRVCHYRTVIKKECEVQVFTKIDWYHLESISKFKQFVVASCEAHLLKWRWMIQNERSKKLDIREKRFDYKRVSRGADIGLQKFQVLKFSSSTFEGRLADSIIAQSLGIAERSLFNWRGEKPINDYNTKLVRSTEYFSDNNYHNGKGLLLTKDRVISTYIDIFCNKFLYIGVFDRMSPDTIYLQKIGKDL